MREKVELMLVEELRRLLDGREGMDVVEGMRTSTSGTSNLPSAPCGSRGRSRLEGEQDKGEAEGGDPPPYNDILDSDLLEKD